LIHEIYVLSDVCDRQVLTDYNLNSTQFRLLCLLHNEKGQRLTTLSERLIISKSSVTRIVDELEYRGWVKRVADPDDRRAQRVVITSAGTDTRNQISEEHQESLDQRMKCLENLELEQLEELLDKLRVGLLSRIEGTDPNGASS
jgi:MarR family 2-MHQ and catechol resistance regulon transcriptional repressor